MPLFSVIIPFRNAANTLPDTLSTLQAQTEQDWEALLVNDNSSDGSVELVRAVAAQDRRLHLLHDTNQTRARGVARTRNLGIAAAQGRYLALLDADDRWLPEKLAAQARVFQSGADIVFTSYRRIDMTGKSLGIIPARPCVTWRDALAGNPIGCLTGAWRHARFPGARMPDIAFHEDYAFWLSLLQDGAVAYGLPDVLAEYRIGNASASSNKRRAAYAVWSILGTQGLNLHQRVFAFLCYAGNALRTRI